MSPWLPWVDVHAAQKEEKARLIVSEDMKLFFKTENRGFILRSFVQF